MQDYHWKLQRPINAIVFDCDGTLSRIEGIDQLAETNGRAAEVKVMTEQAMGETGLNDSLYRARLDLVKPTKEQVTSLSKTYFAKSVLDVPEIIRLFQSLNKPVYIVSAGLHPAVRGFGKLLGIPSENIFAVDIYFDEHGNFKDYEHTSPLVHRDGKRGIIQQIKTNYPELFYVGDGMNDYAAADLATRFVGYGGAFYHEKVASFSEYYITSPSLAPLVPLALTDDELRTLDRPAEALYQRGLAILQGGEVLIRKA